MAAWTTISNALVAVGAKPFATTIQSLRDNTSALGEKDSSVPEGLRIGKWLLGTIIPTSGGNVGLTGLNLTSYDFLEVYVRNVSTGNGSSVLYTGTTTGIVINSLQLTNTLGGAAKSWWGRYTIDLATGFVFGGAVSGSDSVAQDTPYTAMGVPGTGVSGRVTNASTEIDFSVNIGSFSAPASGSPEIAIYGVR
jgi:hypothetical protein